MGTYTGHLPHVWWTCSTTWHVQSMFNVWFVTGPRDGRSYDFKMSRTLPGNWFVIVGAVEGTWEREE